MIIAIDGPSGSGKGTLSRFLCTKYGFSFLETGLLFRATAAKARQQSISLKDEKTLSQIASTLTNNDFEDLQSLRTEQNGQDASKIAVLPLVRQALISYMQTFAEFHGVNGKGAILDGRDIGTVICPNADLKFFITARPEVRAERRVKELQSYGIQCIYEDILHEMLQRDQRDQNRPDAPLKAAKDCIVIDTSDLKTSQVFNLAVKYIDTHLSRHKPSADSKA